jgi:diguanylate cyclase (GGDEF)-like protein
MPEKSEAPRNIEVRLVRLGLGPKLFIALTVVLTLYAVMSGSYLLRYFFNDKARYVLFSLHQSAEASCAKLSASAHSVGEMSTILKENETAQGLIFDTEGKVATENLDEAAGGDLNSTDLWKTLMGRSEEGKLTTLTSEYKGEGQKLFLSACRFESAGTPYWLLLVVDANEALKPANDLYGRMTTLFMFLLLAGLGIFFLIARGLTKALRALTAFADDLGAGNYKRKINVRGSDELGVLADSFSLLSATLEAREVALEKSTELANKDFLTGLWNRRYLDRRLEEYFQLAKRHNHALSVIFLDADHFKKINDTLGHAAGDQILKDIARILAHCLRKTDFIARVGGEEFVTVLPETSLEQALQVAVKIRNFIKAQTFLDQNRVKLTMSMGVTTVTPDVSSASGFIDVADKFAYASKTGGRDRITSPQGTIF